MIKEIELLANGQAVHGSNITVLVGANHSGKTLFLKELKDWVSGPVVLSKLRLIRNIKRENYNASEIKQMLAALGYKLIENDNITNASISGNTIEIERNGKIQSGVITHLIKYLDIQSRLTLIQPTGNISLRESPQNALQTILRNDALRETIREKIYDAFGFYFSIDITAPNMIYIKASKTHPTIEQERAYLEDAVKFHDKTIPIEEYSDGVKSYIGIILSLFGDRHKLILLDEPESFLHPALAYKLGNDIATHALEFNKQIYIATHSAELLMGCLETSNKINIIRLGYNDLTGKSSANLISQEYLKKILTRPEIRHTNFLDSLFYKFVILCEADKDRVFYREIFQRLNRVGCGVNDMLFINSPNGKSSMKHFVDGISKFGIPYAVIVDFDIIEDGLTDLLKAAGLLHEQIQSIHTLANRLKKYCKETGIKIKEGGLTKIEDPDEKSIADNLIKNLRDHGIFIVECGELEYWLNEYNVSPSHKNTWLNEIFEKIGLSTDENDYVQPDSTKDVWKFIADIVNWIKNK